MKTPLFSESQGRKDGGLRRPDLKGTRQIETCSFARLIGFGTLTSQELGREGGFGAVQGLDPMFRIEEVLHPETHGIKKKHPKGCLP